jgi:hypothetical protein
VPGRNLAVLGAQPGPAVRVLATAAAGLLAATRRGPSVVLAVLVDEAVEAADALESRLRPPRPPGHATEIKVAVEGAASRSTRAQDRRPVLGRARAFGADAPTRC